MQTPFTKMHGLGNDYIYFDCVRQPDLVPDPGRVAPGLCDRHTGIGGDGIVLILPDSEADFRMRMFNADGSEAEMCGNAIRCVAKHVYDRGHTRKRKLRIRTGRGILELVLTVGGDRVMTVRVDMGEPILDGPAIPVAVARQPVLNEPIVLASGRRCAFTAVSMGNPHAVIVVDRITDEMVLGDGREIETHALFPKRVNVEFVEVLSRCEVRMRVWERGAGETQACGTGASAVGVACALNGLTDRDLTVHLLGGDLNISWADNNHVYMDGPATFVFDGTVEL
ncbi:MAG: diaminopimelate epimerase [Lentisphaerae bacterium RIFOXYB12_FULL_65_16]|nr:MAG: diaminopimelate epimerase [Lentisphaerae bacterium RIFOXYA12_64_32]OGV89261.1 MAG: diaminopimelate epimerase [Lentisphaerae bacterium RIFOXYB12_FULL_65_16]